MTEDPRAYPTRRQFYIQTVKARIRDLGWVVQGVSPTVAHPGVPFCYTIGLTAAGLPELIMSGLADDAGPLNYFAKSHLGEELTPGLDKPGIASERVSIRVIDAPLAPIGFATEVYGPQARAIQLVWAMPEDNVWPGTPGWPTAARQELFGPAWWLDAGGSR